MIVCADSLKEMRYMSDGAYDAVITDPPFGIGFDYKKGRKDKANNPEDYWKWFQPFWVEIVRVTKPGGLIALWQATPYLRYMWDWYGDDVHIYAACKNFVQLRKTPINCAWDTVVMKYKPGAPALSPEKPKRSVDFYVANTAKWVAQKGSLAKRHPCPRPLDQAVEIMYNFTLPGGHVLDPFAGSGTIGVAATLCGRQYTGIEIDVEFAALARERIRKEV